MKVLAIGDIMGKLGRRVVGRVLPDLKKELGIDLVIANGENIAHGKGMTRPTLQQVKDAGVDVFTTGNHMNKKPEGVEILETKEFPIIRPYNWSDELVSVPGDGSCIVEVSGKKILIVNLIGQAFFKEKFENPFHALDRVLEENKQEAVDAVIVDFHAEATSEKVGMGWHADGKTSLVFGTHTHVPTADQRILLEGTGYVTDLGMCGDHNGVIGVAREAAVEQFLTNLSTNYTLKEEGPAQFNAICATINTDTGRCESIERVDRIVEIG
ncbi:MAG: YmdB family metallophosphoesterase [Candidatus Jacksonbacteria bacterium]|nr:YmdB family metallophosphoesterase [Candidatus Jacksonbacteria bacterium]